MVRETSLKHIPVNASTGFVVFDRVLHSSDYLDCSGQSLSAIDFRLCNSNGQTIDLKCDQITFSIIFDYLKNKNISIHMYI